MSKFTGVFAAAAVAIAAMAGAAQAHQHGVTGQTPATQLAEGRTAATCLKDRQACISAGARTGTWGERYVPPEIIKQCYDAYRACTSQR
jgi:hypothetical protein